MAEKKQSAGAGWKKQTSKGEVINLVIDGKRYNMWPNSYKKEGSKDPDFKIFEDNYVKNAEQSNPTGDLPF